MIHTEQLALFGEATRVESRCLVCKGTMNQPAGDTYVMQRQDYVKIGRSKHVKTRLRELAAHNRQRFIITPPEMDLCQPLTLLTVFMGDIEHQLHERWVSCHVIGEWFLPTGYMKRWVAKL